MSEMELEEICYKDRIHSLEHVQVSWRKKNAFDLLFKYFIFMINSIGRDNRGTVDYLFVNEIKNSNMANNLIKTKEVFDFHGESTALLSFYERCKDRHIKLGRFFPISEILVTGIKSIPIIISAFSGKPQDKRLIKMLCLRFEKIVRWKLSAKEIYLMTDHHFFSSIIAIERSGISSVIQHGLVMDKRFYYPIRAGRFLAWGSRSKELEFNDPKVDISGTYKFCDLNPPHNENEELWLFCIGSLNNEEVKRKLDILIDITKRHGIHLAVKCHPGSLFDVKQWKELYKNDNIIFYKEELLQTLAFDLAISENSTVIMDLIAMRKPFILFDNINGYFAEYAEIIPHGNNMKEIDMIIEQITSIDFNKIAATLAERELNSGNCIIYDKRRK